MIYITLPGKPDVTYQFMHKLSATWAYSHYAAVSFVFY